jgi:type IV secretory pathway VirJ component
VQRTNPFILLVVVLIVLLALVPVVRERWPQTIYTQQFGRVLMFRPWLHQRGFVYVLSGADGWSPADQRTALSFAARDNYVIGIDTRELIAYINHTAKGCLFMNGLFEDYSRVQQRNAETPHFYPPIVLGRGMGASLTYLAQIGAPALALGATVMIDPEPRLKLSPPICEHPATQYPDGIQQISPDRLGPNVPGRLWLDAGASAETRRFAEQIPGHPAAPAPRSRSLRRVYGDALRDIRAEQERSGVADLPLVEAVATNPRHGLFAVLYSGDGGWRDLDRSLAGLLAARGIDVVGVDVLRYYWRTKQPDVAARDLARIMKRYEEHWDADQVILIGFSFGANVIPFMVNRLPPDQRAKVKLITLLSPERATAFEVSPAGWMGKAANATIPIDPELKGLSTIPLQCVYGQDEGKDSLCTTQAAAHFDVIRKPGGHHFDNKYEQLADAIIKAAGLAQ